MLPGKRGAPFYPHAAQDTLGASATARGAKRGGLTDHLSGFHLIPNVGREAMVPGEVVRRQPRAKPKAKEAPKPVPKPVVQQKWEKEPKKKHRDRSPRRQRSLSRERPRSASRSASRSSPREEVKTAAQIAREQEEKRKQAAQDEELRKRVEEEQKKLKELEEVQKKKLEQQAARKSSLKGLFVMTEDEINAEEDAEANRARIAKERARAERKAQAAATDRPEPIRAGYANSVVAAAFGGAESSGSVLVDPAAAGNMTAADLDGRMHDHKFSKVWKDWDAAKKSDPGEVARQFMKIAAIKRRGYAPGGGMEQLSDERRSRSRSRGDRRRGDDRGSGRSRR